MRLTLRASDVYPPEVETLLRTLAARGFFERGLLIGGWAFPIYQRALGIDYPLKTVGGPARLRTKKDDPLRSEAVHEAARGFSEFLLVNHCHNVSIIPLKKLDFHGTALAHWREGLLPPNFAE